MDKRKGMTLLELLVVVGIIGIISVVAIWNYFIAIERAHAKRSVADMRAIGVAWEARGTDLGRYNAAGSLFTWPSETLTQANLITSLTPTWIRTIPQNDGWARPFEFAMDQPFGAGSEAQVYAIRSRGRDGQLDPNYDTTPTDEFDCDIVYANGNFVIYPKKVD